MTYKAIIKPLECLCGEEIFCRECKYSGHIYYPECRQQVARDALDLINRLKAENKKAIKDFTDFAQRAFENPFACIYCKHSLDNGRACEWKREHEDDEETCLGKHFEYRDNLLKEMG